MHNQSQRLKLKLLLTTQKKENNQSIGTFASEFVENATGAVDSVEESSGEGDVRRMCDEIVAETIDLHCVRRFETLAAIFRWQHTPRKVAKLGDLRDYQRAHWIQL